MSVAADNAAGGGDACGARALPPATFTSITVHLPTSAPVLHHAHTCRTPRFLCAAHTAATCLRATACTRPAHTRPTCLRASTLCYLRLPACRHLPPCSAFSCHPSRAPRLPHLPAAAHASACARGRGGVADLAALRCAGGGPAALAPRACTAQHAALAAAIVPRGTLPGANGSCFTSLRRGSRAYGMASYCSLAVSAYHISLAVREPVNALWHRAASPSTCRGLVQARAPISAPRGTVGRQHTRARRVSRQKYRRAYLPVDRLSRVMAACAVTHRTWRGTLRTLAQAARMRHSNCTWLVPAAAVRGVKPSLLAGM